MRLPRRRFSSRFTLALVLGVGLMSAPSPVHADQIFNSWNADIVYNNPASLPVFTLSEAMEITCLRDYHYYHGMGADPTGETISIYSLATGALVGSWAASYNGVGPRNTQWEAYPNAILGPGSYQVVDSDRATWSYALTDYCHYAGMTGANWQSGVGFTMVYADRVVPEPASRLTDLSAICLLGWFAWRRRT